MKFIDKEKERVVESYNPNKEYTEEELVIFAQNGNEEVGEYLIRKYKKVVKKKAHFYFMVGADRDDIVQEGMIGIFKAIQNFDITKQTSFHTFAELCINRQIITAIKQAARMKHSPLNTSVSLNKPISEDAHAVTLAEILSTDNDSDPEALLLLKEVMQYIEGNNISSFSQLEHQVWDQYIKGKTYIEIAKNLGKTPKSIDNAIQRTRRKLVSYLNNSS
ncbi:MAG: RNA polymerase sporulation sigma factor SigH [Eubacteriales bacterium]|nr:RNA polymerase sporulation sigma factor SigH [Eubacteriales bacterium]MDD4582719.1 RNA polymerase sporulation sigma factor SigH [Eubacteriales bacterium]